MPISKYYKGDGKKVMKEMQERYGKEEGKRVFYATANKRKMNPDDPKKKTKKRSEKAAAALSAHERTKVPKKDFAIPEKAEGKDEKKKSGNYPIPDRKHARAALGLVGMHGSSEERAKVRAKVRAKYPDMVKSPDMGKSASLAGYLDGYMGKRAF